MSTTIVPSAPSFRVRGRFAIVRGVLIVCACLALGAAFVGQIWSGPAATTGPAEQRAAAPESPREPATLVAAPNR